jgi:integrase
MPAWSGYHVKSDGRAYFRPYVPKDLKPIIGSYPMVNLGIKASKQAERLALMHYIGFELMLEERRKELAEQALKPRPLPLSDYTDEDRQRFATQLAQGFNRTQHAAIKAFRPRDELLALHDLLALVAGDVLSASGAEGLARVTEVFLTAAGVPFKRDEPAFKTLVFEFATALDSEFVKPSTRRLHGREAVPPPPLPDSPKSVSQVPEALTVGNLVAAYVQEKQRSRNEYTRKVIRCLELFSEMVGATLPITSLRQLHVTNFLRDICRLPSTWAHHFDRGASIAELLATEADEVMSPTTFKDNYRAPLKAFLRDSQRDYGDAGFPALIVDGIEYTGDREPGEDKQRALRPHELQQLFEGPEFAAIAADPTADAMYWLPIIALYTGARPREICQLNPQCDWGISEDIPFLTFSMDTPAGVGIRKSVKKREERSIPMHSELIRLGLPTYLERQKREGADRLFPSAGVKSGNPFEALGATFTELLKAVGLYDNDAPPGRKVLGMYVMRKTFITFAAHQNVVSFEMTGHSADTTRVQRQHYITEHEPLAKMDRELRKLALPVSIPNRPT